MKRIKITWLLAFLWIASVVFGQEAVPANWFNLDLQKDGIPGVSTELVYKELLKGRQGRPVVVAVIDGGVDYRHEDLREVMWVNPGEIAGNGIDDDRNGYVDDIHGWNFIGNKNGEHVQFDNLEVTRQYIQYHRRFGNVDPSSLSGKDKKAYNAYEEIREEFESKRQEMQENAAFYKIIYEFVLGLKSAINKDQITIDDIRQFKSDDPMMISVAKMMESLMDQGNSFQSLEKDLLETAEYFGNQADYYYNPEYDSRNIVGDRYEDLTDRYYGNPDVKGPDADHGTHVAGIIAAVRGNGIGMDGVASNVRIMAIRTVPDGDERDKDVANAIMYAVDNGASVINMSFGKGYSPQKELVDKAVRYALKHDVLLVHASGNDGKENFLSNNYPNDQFLKKGLFGPKFAENWLEVGASGWTTGEQLAADFSNYSSSLVDVFAPGVDIYSTTTENQYENNQGTSMAAPVVSGIAALLRSYFPDLTAVQIKDIIMSSVVRHKGKVAEPGSGDLVPFSQLSVTGGVVNAYKAVEMAMTVKGKKKGNAGTVENRGERAGKKNKVVVP